MNKKAKLEELLKKREIAQARLDKARKKYRGVIHESAVSEINYSEYHVCEAHLRSIDEEIEKLR